MAESPTRRKLLKTTGGAVLGLGLISMSGCVSSIVGSGGVKVGSKRFVEQRILGYMSYETIQANTDVNVGDETGLGGSTSNFQALKSGNIGTYWEYTGTAWSTFPPKHDKIPSSAQKLYEKLKAEMKKEHSIMLLNRARFDNTYVFIANPDWVEKTGVKTLSGFAEYVKNGHTDITVVMSAQELERADGWPGLIKYYEFTKMADKLNVKTVSTELTYQAVGKGEADVGFGYNTNPKIPKFNIKILNDDKKFFPPYNPAPFVNMKTLENNPAIREPLNRIGPKLTTDKIRHALV